MNKTTNQFEVTLNDGTAYEVDCETGTMNWHTVSANHRKELHKLVDSNPFFQRVSRAYYKALDRGY